MIIRQHVYAGELIFILIAMMFGAGFARRFVWWPVAVVMGGIPYSSHYSAGFCVHGADHCVHGYGS